MKTFYKFISETQITKAPLNGFVNGSGVSNLNAYFNAHESEANTNGYFELSDDEVDMPTYDEATQYLEAEYSLVGNKIKVVYAVKEMESANG